mgnify:CR=1 FL=1
MNEMRDYLKLHAEHQILKYAASKQMFCPFKECERILDYRKTVIIEFTDGKVITMCYKCFESLHVQASLIKYAKAVKEITKYRKT